MHQGKIGSMSKCKYLLITLLIGIDFITKLLAAKFLSFGSLIEISNFFNLTLSHNYGAAFGIGNIPDAWYRLFFPAMSVICAIIIWAYLLFKNNIFIEDKYFGWGLLLILAGCIGNGIDRIFYGYVIDFIDVYYNNIHWPTFNFADIYITLGAGLIILSVFTKPEPN